MEYDRIQYENRKSVEKTVEESLQRNWDRNEKNGGKYEIVDWMYSSKHPEFDEEGSGFPSETSDIKFEDAEGNVWDSYEDKTSEEKEAERKAKHEQELYG